MKMNEKELEDDLKSYQNRVSHLETLIDGLQSDRVSKTQFNNSKPKILMILNILLFK
jgi:hypothetical protein